MIKIGPETAEIEVFPGIPGNGPEMAWEFPGLARERPGNPGPGVFGSIQEVATVTWVFK